MHLQGRASTIELPRRMRMHSTFYVGRLRPYYQYEASSENENNLHAQESPTDYCDRGPNSHVGPSATQSRDEPPLARRARDESRVHYQAKRTRIPIGSSTDRYEAVARSSSSRADDCTRPPRPPSTRSGRGHSGRISPAGPAAEPDLVFPPPPKPLVDFHGGRRFHVGHILIHRVKNGKRTRYLVR